MKQFRTILVCIVLCALAACASSVDRTDQVLDRPPYAVWTDSIRQFPRQSLYYYERGRLFVKNNDSTHAVHDLEQALAIAAEPDYAIVLSSFWLDHGQPDSARTVIRPALGRFPYNQLLRGNLFTAFFGESRFDEAMRVSDTALHYDSTSAGNWYNHAMAQDALKDSAGALRSLEHAYRLDSVDATLTYELANRYADAGNPAALAICDRIIHQQENTQKKPDPYTIKGIYYANVGKSTEAIACFDQSIAIEYTFLQAYLEKGSLLFKLHRYADALKVFNLSTTVDNTFADGYYWTGR